MIPVQDNWLHIDNKFINSCEQIPNNTYSNNLAIFKQLGLFKLLLPDSMGGRNGHLQDLLECQIAVAEQDVHTANSFSRIAVAPYLIKQFGDAVFEKIFGADNDALVFLYSGDVNTALSMEVDSEYDWIVVQNNDTYCLINVADRKILPEHTITFQDLRNYNGLSWFQIFNRVLTTSALGGLDKVIKLSINNSDSELQAVLGMALSELDEMRLTLHRNINHALLHIESNEQIPLYDRVKYKLQAANAWFKAVKHLKKVDLLAENTEVSAIVSGVCSMNIEHLNDINAGFMEYIGYFQQQNTDDMYI